MWTALSMTMLLAAASRAYPAYLQPDLQSYGGGRFDLSASQIFGDDDRAFLVVRTAIPYRQIVFFKKGNRYVGSYRVFLNIKNEKGRYVGGEVFEETITVGSYAETKSPSKVSSTKKVMPIEPGKYKVFVAVEVINTSLRFEREREVRIVGRGVKRLELTDPVYFVPSVEMYGKAPPDGEIALSPCPAADATAYEINSTGNFSGFDVWPRVSYVLMMPLGELPPTCEVSTRVTGSNGRVMLYHRRSVDVSGSAQLRLCMDFNIDNFPLGIYEISTTAGIPGTDSRTINHSSFSVLLSRSMLAGNFDSTLRLLSIFADEEELADLERAAPDERLHAWLRFWEARESDGRAVVKLRLGEFLHRLKHVLKNFSKYRPGWETDMGRIYVKYGEPDKVTEGYGGVMGSHLQLWYYFSKNIVFIFQDSIGTGEYDLVDTQII
jgi:GWxTD domain-containing protein